MTSSRNVPEEIKTYLSDCTLCPRRCHADRLSGQRGYCGQGAEVTAARAALHFWEEPCISGTQGSGAVFFSGCSLRCVFCQNHDISVGNRGRAISGERLVEIFLELQEKGAANVNLVTAGHFLPQVCRALRDARAKGLSIPVVYNTGGYEEVSSLRLLDGLADVYLPDLKFHSAELSAACSHAPDYFEKASAAIDEMLRQTGPPVIDSGTGLMRRGVIVRHLVLPGQVRDSKKILRYLREAYGNDIYVSILNQYTPIPMQAIPAAPEPPCSELGRRVTAEEYARVLEFADKIGIEQGFIQEDGAAETCFIPAFDGQGL